MEELSTRKLNRREELRTDHSRFRTTPCPLLQRRNQAVADRPVALQHFGAGLASQTLRDRPHQQPTYAEGRLSSPTPSGMQHSVEGVASSLYAGAVVALADRRDPRVEWNHAPTTRLTVAVKASTTDHAVSLRPSRSGWQAKARFCRLPLFASAPQRFTHRSRYRGKDAYSRGDSRKNYSPIDHRTDHIV